MGQRIEVPAFKNVKLVHKYHHSDSRMKKWLNTYMIESTVEC